MNFVWKIKVVSNDFLICIPFTIKACSSFFYLAQQLSEAKSKLWSDMRQIYSRAPNFMLFNAIMRLKEEQLQHITTLSKTVNNDSHLMLLSKENCSEFEFNLLRTKVNLLGLSVKYLVARQERQQLDSQFLRLYCEFEPKLLEKVKMFNIHVKDEKNEETLREYIVQYNARLFIKGQNESLLQHIDSLKAEIDSSSKEIENHEVRIILHNQLVKETRFYKIFGI